VVHGMSWLYATLGVMSGMAAGFVLGCRAGHRYLDTKVGQWDRLNDEGRARVIRSLHPIDGGATFESPP
jgi:membrane protein DedA with SNARE-associated domain